MMCSQYIQPKNTSVPRIKNIYATCIAAAVWTVIWTEQPAYASCSGTTGVNVIADSGSNCPASDSSYTSASGQTTFDAQANSSITAAGDVTIQASGDGTNAINIESGANIATTGLTLGLTGNGSNALNIQTDGSFTATGTLTINTDGDNTSAFNINGNVNTTGAVTVQVTGNGTNPVNLQAGGSFTANAISVTVTGSNPNVFNIQGNLNATTLTANLTGDSANGINLQTGGNITTTGLVSVTTMGNGVNALNIGSTLSTGPITVNMNGTGNNGLNVQTGGSITAADAIAVTITGDNVNALSVQTSGSITAADTVAINLTGNNVTAFNLSGATTVTGAVDVTLGGNNSNIFNLQTGGSLTVADALTTHITGNGINTFNTSGTSTVALTGPVDVTMGGDNGNAFNIQTDSSFTSAQAITAHITGNNVNGLNISGSFTSQTPVTLNITGDNTNAIAINNNGSVAITGLTTLQMSGQNSNGLSVNSGTATITGDINVLTSGDNSNALNINSGTISVSGTATLQTTGDNAFGAVVGGGGSGIGQINFARGVDISTAGSSHGLIVLLAGNITVAGPLTVHTTGPRAFGAAALYSNAATINLQDAVTITTTGGGTSNANYFFSGPGGLAALLGGIITVDGHTIVNASGNYATGLNSSSAQLTLNQGATITMSGAHSNGVWVTDGYSLDNLLRDLAGFPSDSPSVNDPGILTLKKNWQVTTTDASSNAVHLTGKNSQILATDVTGQGVIHAQGTALRLDSEGSMTLEVRDPPNTGTIIPGGYAIAKRSTGLQASLLNTTLTSVAGTVIEVAGVAKDSITGNHSNVTLTNSTAFASPGQKLLNIGSQTINFFNRNLDPTNPNPVPPDNDTATFTTDGFDFIANNAILTGDITVAENSQNINLIFNRGTQLTGNINVSADSQNVNVYFNPGTQFIGNIDPASLNVGVGSSWTLVTSSTLNTLTLAGTILFQAPAPAPTFVPKTLTLNNLIGQGGTITVNADPGIASDQIIVDGGTVTGTTLINIVDTAERGSYTTEDGGAIVKAINNAVIPASAFALSRRIAAGAYDYTLQTNSRGLLFLSAAKTSALGTTVPNYRPAVPVDMVAQPLASRLSLSMLDTYRDRMGEYTLLGQDTATTHKGWGRLFGATGSVNSAGDFSTAGAAYDFNISGFQVGKHFYHEAATNHVSHMAGAYLGVGSANSNVDAAYSGSHAGNLSVQAYTVGAYWTRHTPQGWYTDAILQATRYSNIQGQSSLNENMQSQGWSTEASLENGLPIGLPLGFTLEPQVQLIYQYQKLNDAQDGLSKIYYGNVQATYTRLGTRLSKILDTTPEQPLMFWLGVNLWGNLSGQGKATFTHLSGKNPTTIKTDLGGFWGQLELALLGRLTRQTHVSLSANYNHSVDTNTNRSFGGRLNIQHTW